MLIGVLVKIRRINQKLGNVTVEKILSGDYGKPIIEVTFFYKRLASLLAHEWGDDYLIVMGWLKCSLSFSLLRSAIQCIRDARSTIGHYVSAPSTDGSG